MLAHVRTIGLGIANVASRDDARALTRIGHARRPPRV
eukprot:COSAG02_NODE_58319_length_277_cov_4.943820_1_plen_36_part_01